mmetsp:Transcript_10228/g.31239  ORF Transcript_10228/g.31239 Transcript_10228/m.31239 type:complete len:227 (+) Transcript_10228:1017-1697(+)
MKPACHRSPLLHAHSHASGGAHLSRALISLLSASTRSALARRSFTAIFLRILTSSLPLDSTESTFRSSCVMSSPHSRNFWLKSESFCFWSMSASEGSIWVSAAFIGSSSNCFLRSCALLDANDNIFIFLRMRKLRTRPCSLLATCCKLTRFMPASLFGLLSCFTHRDFLVFLLNAYILPSARVWSTSSGPRLDCASTSLWSFLPLFAPFLWPAISSTLSSPVSSFL